MPSAEVRQQRLTLKRYRRRRSGFLEFARHDAVAEVVRQLDFFAHQTLL
jgi:hypothetical protein